MKTPGPQPTPEPEPQSTPVMPWLSAWLDRPWRLDRPSDRNVGAFDRVQDMLAARYGFGRPLMTHDRDDTLIDLESTLLDALVYLAKLIQEGRHAEIPHDLIHVLKVLSQEVP